MNFLVANNLLARKRARSSIGRAPVLHSGGMEFESPRVHNVKKNDACASFFSCGSHSHISSADGIARRGSEHLRIFRVRRRNILSDLWPHASLELCSSILNYR